MRRVVGKIIRINFREIKNSKTCKNKNILFFSSFFQGTMSSTIIFIVLILLVPLFGYMVWKNKHMQDLLFVGWVPILIAMVISSLAGVVLERYVGEYKGVALLTPVLIGLSGNLGSIYASRISTSLHGETKENCNVVEWTLLAMNIPIQVIFLIIIWAFQMGELRYTGWFFFAYFLVSMICVSYFFPSFFYMV